MSRKHAQIRLGGCYQAGDPYRTPEGKTRLARNVFLRPNGRIEARDGWKKYGPNAEPGFFMKWYDGTNARTTLLHRSKSSLQKMASNGTWTSLGATAFTSAYSLYDYCNVLGKVVWSETGYTGATTKRTLYYYDGTTVNARAVGTDSDSVYSKTLASFLNRLFLGNVEEIVSNQIWLGAVNADPYVTALGTFWIGTNVNLSVVSNTEGVYSLITPTATTGTCQIRLGDFGAFDSSLDTDIVYLCQLQGTDASTDMPVTIQIVVSAKMARLTPYNLGDMRIPDAGSNGFRYRCTVQGTSAAGAPALGTTIGGTTVDGGVTWTCEGTDVLAEQQTTVFNATSVPGVQSTWLTASSNSGPTQVALIIKFGTTSVTTWSKVGIKVSFKDGKAASDPSKANFGQQLTYGKLKHRFFNLETNAANTFEYPQRAMWTETLTLDLKASNYADLVEEMAEITAIGQISSRLFFFKKNSIFCYVGTADPDLPIARTTILPGVGCLDTTALDGFENILCFIGSSEVYAFDGSATPIPLAGDGMREAMFNQSASTWVPSQSTYNRPILAIDPLNRQIWCYIQKGTIHVYQMPEQGIVGGEWTTIDIEIDNAGTTDEISDMVYHEGYMYISSATGGVMRLSSGTTLDETNASSSTYNVPVKYWLPFFEATAPRRDILVEKVTLHHGITNSGEKVKASVSLDGGSTFTKFNEVIPSPDPATTAARQFNIPLWQRAESLVVELSHTGNAGAAAFTIHEADATIQVLSTDDAVEKSNPTQSSSSL